MVVDPVAMTMVWSVKYTRVQKVCQDRHFTTTYIMYVIFCVLVYQIALFLVDWELSSYFYVINLRASNVDPFFSNHNCVCFNIINNIPLSQYVYIWLYDTDHDPDPDPEPNPTLTNPNPGRIKGRTSHSHGTDFGVGS